MGGMNIGIGNATAAAGATEHGHRRPACLLPANHLVAEAQVVQHGLLQVRQDVVMPAAGLFQVVATAGIAGVAPGPTAGGQESVRAPRVPGRPGSSA